MIRNCAIAVLLVACGDDAKSTTDAKTADAKLVDGAPGIDGSTSVLGILHVNEVMPSNATSCTDASGAHPDWVELYNSGATDLDLGGFTLTDDLEVPLKVTLLPGLVVPAHGYKLIFCDEDVDQGVDHVNFKLSAGGESIAIYDRGENLIDSYTWGATGDDVAYARVPDGTGDFQRCAPATCAASNGTSCSAPAIDAAPDALILPDAPAGTPHLYVNEVNPSNLTTCPDETNDTTKDWFEIYNAGTVAVDLTGYSVTDDLTMPTKSVLPAGITIPAGGRQVFYADQTTIGANHVNFKLSKGGETVAIFTPAGALIDSFTWASAIPDDHSYARFPDGTGALVGCSVTSCGAANGAACTGTSP